MKTRIIEPGSLMHGLLNSDFDGFLLYRYNELLKVFEDIFKDKTAEENRRFIDLFKDQLQVSIADNNRVIRDLHINIENEKVKEGFVSLSRIKLNNLQSVNEKSECFIRDLERFKLLHSSTEKNNSPTAPDFMNELAQIAEAVNKFKVGIPMQEIIDHFKIMTTKKNRNGTPYLTPDQFVSFLKRGFLKDYSQSPQKINCATGEKGFVIKRFYEFYVLAVSKYSYPNKKQEFIELFTDCFDNWTSKSIETFFKPDKVKERW